MSDLQEDMVWQPAPRKGRDSIRNGIKSIRKLYPDARQGPSLQNPVQAAITQDLASKFRAWGWQDLIPPDKRRGL